MKTSTEHLRDDIEAQFELPHMPPPMTARRSQDIRKPCDRCEASQCPCIGWKAFDVV